MGKIRFCHENAGAVICENGKCEHCGWHGPEMERRKEFIHKNGLCRTEDYDGNTYFVFRGNKETGKYAMPSDEDKKAWTEYMEKFNPEKVAARVQRLTRETSK